MEDLSLMLMMEKDSGEWERHTEGVATQSEYRDKRERERDRE
jgi:hypothetical protein